MTEMHREMDSVYSLPSDQLKYGENDCDGVTAKITPATDASTCGDDEVVEI